MKILFVTTTLGTRGGIQRVTTVKANCFADMKGNQVAIAFSDRLGWPENSIHPLSEKVKVYDMDCPFGDRVPKRFDIFWRFPQKAIRLRKRIKAVVEDFNPDVIISTGQFEKYIIPFVKLFRRRFVTIREYHFSSNYRQIEYRVRNGKDSFKPKLINWVENNLLAPLFDGNYLLTRQDKEENLRNSKYFNYMWNPSSFKSVDHIDFREKAHIVVAAGRLTKQKNFQDLLKIWAKTKRLDWKLRILGDGEDRSMLESLADELDIAGSVEIVGYTDKVQQYMKDASIFAGTSTFEGFMLVLCEAMSQGCAPISYQTPYGPNDIISDGINGCLIPMYDTESFSTKLSQLIADTTLRENIAKAALQRSRDFDVNTICNKWITEYKNLLNIRRK